MYDTRIDDLVRAAKGNLRFSALAVHRDHDLALVPPCVLLAIEATPMIG